MSYEKVVIRDCTLYRGDALEILPLLPKVDACITDPPYGIALADNSQGGRYGRPRRAWELEIVGDDDQYTGLEVLAWAERLQLPTITFASPRKPWPGEWRSLLVWDKGPAVGGGGDTNRCFKQSWELIQIARNGPLRNGRDSSVITEWVNPSLSAEHPAAKPVPLLRYLVEQITDAGDIVCDPCMGSASTGVACIGTGRRFVGCEIEQRYFDLSCRNIERAYADQALLDLMPEPAVEQQPSFLEAH